MSQVSVSPVTAHGRSTWRALRPLLILGGFVAVWWALMTGVAHADGSDKAPRHSVLDQVRSTAKAHHATPVKDLVRKTQHAVKANTSKASADVRKVVRPVTEKVTQKVTSVVKSTPVVRDVSKTATTTVSQTVAKTRDVLDKTPAGPVVDPVLKPVDDVVDTATQKPESSTGQGNSHSKSHSGTSTATSFAQQLPSVLETSGHGSATAATSDQAKPSQDGGSPLDGPRGDPSAPGPCASPSGSGSTSFTPVGTLESSLLVAPSVLRDTHTWRLARLPGGPAYEPGSSPD